MKGLRGISPVLEALFDDVYSARERATTARSDETLKAAPLLSTVSEAIRTPAAEIDLIRSKSELLESLRSATGKHYVYILRKPDGETRWGGVGTPFYVGIGQGARLFSHEEEARDTSRDSAKLSAIRSIWAVGQEVLREIDSIHEREPWDREEELINSIGLLSAGQGPLTNSQSYSVSTKVNGVELRKYAEAHIGGDLDSIPTKFKLMRTRLKAGPNEPRSRTSVFGKIYTVAEENPGATGEELVRLLQRVDFSGNKSAYTQSGAVCAAWLVGYVEGAYFRSDRQHLQDHA